MSMGETDFFSLWFDILGEKNVRALRVYDFNVFQQEQYQCSCSPGVWYVGALFHCQWCGKPITTHRRTSKGRHATFALKEWSV